MGWFGKKEQPAKIILPENSKCCRCGKKIKESEFAYIDRKVYWMKCFQVKRDLELFVIYIYNYLMYIKT